MFHPTTDIHTYFHPGKRVHLAGIGGVSMCALAEVLKGMGVTVQGSDMTDSDTTTATRRSPGRLPGASPSTSVPRPGARS